MFERFTEQARHVIVLAQEEALLLKHNYIGTEHLLLGLMREERGLAAAVLTAHDLSVESVRDRVTKIIGRGEEVTSGQIPFTPRAKNVLELSLCEALDRGHNYIGTEHLLMGLARENDGVAARVLLDFGVREELLIDEVTTELLEEAPPLEQLRDPQFILGRLTQLVDSLRAGDRLRLAGEAEVMAYAAGAVNGLLEADVLSQQEASHWLRRIQAPEHGVEAGGEFTGRVLERLVPAPEQPGDGFRVLAAELYRDGCIVRLQVPPGGALPMTVELDDSEGTDYRQAEPPDWQGSEGVLGEVAFVPAVPEAGGELTVIARFKDGSEHTVAIPL